MNPAAEVADPALGSLALEGRTIGVLALQGDVASHRSVLEACGASVRRVLAASDLGGLDGLVLPGGESTTMTLAIEREALAEPLRAAIAGGLKVLGTCAGMILLDDEHLDVLDLHCRRNAFGAQLHSFESELAVDGIDGAVHGVFIRAPWVERCGDGVEVLATVERDGGGDAIVAVRSGNVVATAFHPEQARDPRLHILAFA